MKKKETTPVTERIKTFEDARKEVGRLAEGGNEDLAILLADYESNADNIYTKGVLAYMKLCVIVAALNEGWKPEYAEGEDGWCPWFCVWNKEELQNKSDAWIKEHNIHMFGGSSNTPRLYGLSCVTSLVAWSYAYSNFSSLLALKSEELAKYCGKQFIDIWAEYIFG